MATTAIGGTFWRSPGWPVPVWIHDNADHLCATPYKLGEMMAPNVPPIEMRSPGAQPPLVRWNNGGLAGLGLISPLVGSGGPGMSQSFFAAPTGPTGPVTPGGGGGSPLIAPAQPAQAGQSVNPVFFDVNGNVITQATCGQIYSMTVPGYEGQVLQIVQTKNGAPSFTGPMRMPMGNYASKCSQDEGSYTVQAFTLAGQMLGSTNFTVLPSAVSATPAGGPPLSPAGLPPLPAATGTPAPPPGTTSSTAALPASSITTPVLPTTAAAAPTFFSTLTTTDWLVLAVLAVVVVNQASKGR
jgi:hypothetical protein